MISASPNAALSTLRAPCCCCAPLGVLLQEAREHDAQRDRGVLAHQLHQMPALLACARFTRKVFRVKGKNIGACMHATKDPMSEG